MKRSGIRRTFAEPARRCQERAADAALFAAQLRSSTRLQIGLLPRVVVVDDFDGDGRPDLVVANQQSSDPSVLLSRPPIIVQ